MVPQPSITWSPFHLCDSPEILSQKWPRCPQLHLKAGQITAQPSWKHSRNRNRITELQIWSSADRSRWFSARQLKWSSISLSPSTDSTHVLSAIYNQLIVWPFELQVMVVPCSIRQITWQMTAVRNCLDLHLTMLWPIHLEGNGA